QLANCTLRAAIQASNLNTSGTDTINIPAGTYVLTIQGRGDDRNLSGDLDIRDAVNIVGTSGNPSTVIIDGNASALDANGNFINPNQGDRVFDVDPNSSVGTTTISNLTIRNGNPGGDAGGGLLNFSRSATSTLNLSNVIVTGNFG